mgnify:CR=1 FL=1
MDPVHLHLFLAAACTSCGLPTGLMQRLYAQALRQYHERYPLAGCAVAAGLPVPTVVSVGRN